jgi:hypothetical protein
MTEKILQRDIEIYRGYRALRDEGYTRDKALDILKQSDYSYLSRKYIKHIIKHCKKHCPHQNYNPKGV